VSDRTDLPTTWDERATLATFLDYARATAVFKARGLSDDDARKAPLPGSPLMSVAGVVNHLRWVEHFWIESQFLGGEDRGPWTDEEPDREFSMVSEVPLAQVLEEYEAQSERFGALVAGPDLDERAQKPVSTGELVTLRWVLFHLLEETARHNGHLDILRELADGVTGD
jgi:uncharacterized damage-inducible protein DinB